MTARKPLRIKGFLINTPGKKPGKVTCQAGTRFAKVFATDHSFFLADGAHYEYANQAVIGCFLGREDSNLMLFVKHSTRHIYKTPHTEEPA